MAAWPTEDVPTGDEAQHAVSAVLAGKAGGLDSELVTRLANVTDLERAAYEGEGGEHERLLRSATALRWRLGAANVTAPTTGTFDADAVAALLAEADALLAELKRAGEGANDDVAAALDAIRTAIVREAVEVGNVIQRLSTAEEPSAPAATAAKVVHARVLSMVAGDGAAERGARARSSRKMWVALAVAIIAAAGYHGYSYLNRPPPLIAPAGVPAEAVASTERGGRFLVVTRDGKPLAAADLARLRSEQAARGNEVVEMGPGVYRVQPQRQAPPPGGER